MVFHCFQRFELLKFIKTSMKNWCNFTSGKYKPKNWWKSAFGKVLGVIWAWFEMLWGLFWALLGAFGRLFDPSKPNFYIALVQDGLQEAFWIDFGRVWGGFGCVLGEFGLSKLRLLRHMVISWTLWVSPAASHFATGTPALPRFASRSVIIRGGSGTTYAC